VEAGADQWSHWVLERRDAGNSEQRAVTLARLGLIRDRVLANAEPLHGATLLDVGTGDGLIGLAALDAVGASGRVIFSDVSEVLLDRCREAVASHGMTDRARFVTTSAEELAGIPDGSIDVATTRSVLIYVPDKPRAFASLHRVLRPGGRISIFEPLNCLMYPEPDGRLWGYDLSPVANLVAKVRAMFIDSGDPRFRAAMMDFDDRDLAILAEHAGFDRVHVECHIDVAVGPADPPVSLDAFLDRAPNPNAPTLREALAAALTEQEQDRFLTALERALIERRAITRMAVAYLSATKPLLSETAPQG
jgi:arsenite methyltransferase